MDDIRSESQCDLWSDWLLHRRHADDAEYGRVVRTMVERYADRVLDGARLASGMTLADIGSGEGLIAFRAIDRIGPSLRVLLTDISLPMLRHAKEQALQRGVSHQCILLQCPAENLAVNNASVDVATTRSVLAYIPDKNAALREFHRVLKPGGSISLAEPLFRDEAFIARALRDLLDTQPSECRKRFLILMHRWKSAQFPDTEEKISMNPITNYTERDLLRLVQESGFIKIHLEFHIDVLPCVFPSWKAFLDSSPHPWAPSLGAILTERFSLEERQFLEQIVRPPIESGQSTMIDRMVYITATKP